MPKIKQLKSRKPPPGFADIEEDLEIFNRKMREAESQPHEGKRKCESLWQVIKINSERSRFVFDLFFVNKKISKELFDYLIKQGWADGALISKWKKSGYNKLCCMQCISTINHSHGGVCICRVPRSDLDKSIKVTECMHCGCKGCASASVSEE